MMRSFFLFKISDVKALCWSHKIKCQNVNRSWLSLTLSRVKLVLHTIYLFVTPLFMEFTHVGMINNWLMCNRVLMVYLVVNGVMYDCLFIRPSRISVYVNVHPKGSAGSFEIFVRIFFCLLYLLLITWLCYSKSKSRRTGDWCPQ